MHATPTHACHTLALLHHAHGLARASPPVAARSHPFEARNYGTITSSRIEWAFVARPTEKAALQPYLAALGHCTGEWPQGCRGGALPRTEMPYSEYKNSEVGNKLDARLCVEGEQPLSEVEFVALRACTLPRLLCQRTIPQRRSFAMRMASRAFSTRALAACCPKLPVI